MTESSTLAYYSEDVINGKTSKKPHFCQEKEKDNRKWRQKDG